MGLFPNTAFDTSIQNASEPQMRNMKNSRAILNVSNQGAAAFWTRGGKVGIREQSRYELQCMLKHFL
jgi:hypothetical protein